MKHLTPAAGVLLALAFLSQAAVAQRARITLSGVYRDVGAAPAPTENFSLVFDVARSPLVCGGSSGAFIACGPSKPEYTNGALDVILSQGEGATLLFRDASAGGGFAIYQQDVGLNRLSFVIGSSVLFSGGLANPFLLDGVYSIASNPACSDPRQGCTYNSYAGQGFASGDPVNNPFNDPITLQSYDPLTSGTITIESLDAVVATPEPSGALLLVTGLVVLSWASDARRGTITARRF
ncbi:hypothetical protein BH09GEM1_BH09GEM1_21540 [soil metagenome]